MSNPTRLRLLRVLLIVMGATCIVAVFPLMHLWPAGWRWHPYNPAYEHMIVAVYAILGVHLMLAARAPHEHSSLIRFAAWSSLAHGLVMAIDALQTPGATAHLYGDVPPLLVAGGLLLYLLPSRNAMRGAGTDLGAPGHGDR